MASRGGGAKPPLREVRDPVRQASWLGADTSLAPPVSRCRRRHHGSPAENRHGGAPRGVPVAPGQVRASLARASRLASATERKSAPVGAPPAPHQGPDRPLSSRRWAQARRSVSQAGGDAATSEGTKRQGKATTRTQICAAGTRSAPQGLALLIFAAGFHKISWPFPVRDTR